MWLSSPSVISCPVRYSTATWRTERFIASLLLVVETMRLAPVTWSWASTV